MDSTDVDMDGSLNAKIIWWFIWKWCARHTVVMNGKSSCLSSHYFAIVLSLSRSHSLAHTHTHFVNQPLIIFTLKQCRCLPKFWLSFSASRVLGRTLSLSSCSLAYSLARSFVLAHFGHSKASFLYIYILLWTLNMIE